jgi:hypothetical protein
VRWCVHKVGVSVAVVVATAVGLHLLGFSPWAGEPAANLIEYGAVVGIVGLCNLLDPPRVVADPGATMRLSFVGELSALIFFGPIPMTLAATIGALARAYADPQGSQAIRRTILDLTTVCAATQAAGLAHTLLGGAPSPLVWPGQGLPLAGAVVAYCFITCAVADVIAPLASTVAPTHNWPRQAFRGCPGHFIGAAIALAIIELVEHQAWNLVPVAALPLYFAWDAYRTHAERAGRQDRRLMPGARSTTASALSTAASGSSSGAIRSRSFSSARVRVPSAPPWRRPCRRLPSQSCPGQYAKRLPPGRRVRSSGSRSRGLPPIARWT